MLGSPSVLLYFVGMERNCCRMSAGGCLIWRFKYLGVTEGQIGVLSRRFPIPHPSPPGFQPQSLSQLERTPESNCELTVEVPGVNSSAGQTEEEPPRSCIVPKEQTNVLRSAGRETPAETANVSQSPVPAVTPKHAGEDEHIVHTYILTRALPVGKKVKVYSEAELFDRRKYSKESVASAVYAKMTGALPGRASGLRGGGLLPSEQHKARIKIRSRSRCGTLGLVRHSVPNVGEGLRAERLRASEGAAGRSPKREKTPAVSKVRHEGGTTRLPNVSPIRRAEAQVENNIRGNEGPAAKLSQDRIGRLLAKIDEECIRVCDKMIVNVGAPRVSMDSVASPVSAQVCPPRAKSMK